MTENLWNIEKHKNEKKMTFDLVLYKMFVYSLCSNTFTIYEIILSMLFYDLLLGDVVGWVSSHLESLNYSDLWNLVWISRLLGVRTWGDNSRMMMGYIKNVKDGAGRPEWGVRGLGTGSALRWKVPDTHLKHPRQIFHEKQAVSWALNWQPSSPHHEHGGHWWFLEDFSEGPRVLRKCSSWISFT